MRPRRAGLQHAVERVCLERVDEFERPVQGDPVPAHDLSIKEHAPERLEARRNNTVADPASPCLGGVPYLVVIGDHGIKVGGFICRCEFSTSLRRPGAGRMARRVIARPALALPRRSSGPVGVSGMVRRALDLIDETLAASYDTVSTITLNDGPRVTENDVLPTSASHPLYEAVT